MLKGKTKYGKTALLRPMKISESEVYRRWFNDPEVTQSLVTHVTQVPPALITKEEEKKTVRQFITSPTDKTFVIEAEGKPIGACGLHKIDRIHRTARVAITIGEKDYWNQGYGTAVTRMLINYGFDELGLECISSSALEFNKPSIKMLRKLGFREESRSHKAVTRKRVTDEKEQHWDVLHFVLLRDEWAKNR
jgi:RimJ/RimL family protein N-acetyltransferase